nr:hypothetical protein [Tanacetum cinerariifolium]GFA37990.1 hypothetical protein [Tanacetum cinerariifolium]
DGTDFESRVPDEQHLKTTDVDEETEDEDDENKSVDKSDGNDDDDGSDDHDKDSDDEWMKSDRDEILDPNLTNVDQTEHEEEDVDENKANELVQSSYISSDFTRKLLNLKNPSPADNEIASLMDTTARYAIIVLEITSSFTTTIPLPHSFNDRVTNLEKDLSEIKQVDRYAQAISLIPAIVDRYINNQLGEAIHKAIQSHNVECSKEAQAEKQEYIDNVDSTVRTIIREEVKTQLPKILPIAVSAFATPAAASLSEFELTKILLEKMEQNKSHLRVDQKKKLYDALVESYNTNKDLFNTYGEVFTLKRSRDDNEKDRDPSAGLDQGTKRKKSSKEAELSRDSI